MHTPVIDRAHLADPAGTQQVYRFPNGYGASVIHSEFSYGADSGLFELAVIEFDGEDNDAFHLTYATPVTEDVIGHLSPSAVSALLDQIAALPAQ